VEKLNGILLGQSRYLFGSALNIIHKIVHIGMNYMKKRHIAGIIFLIIIFIFFVPYLINEAYNRGGYPTNWDAKDVLVFYGSVLGGIATLIAVFLTIADGNKQREKDKKKSQNRERYLFVSGLLFNSLYNLDGSNLFVYKNHIDEISKSLPCVSALNSKQYCNHVSPQKLSDLIESANRSKNLEINFFLEERHILSEALKKIQSYSKEYLSLLLRLSDPPSSDGNFLVDNILEKIETLYNRDYDKLVTSVHENMKIFEQHLLGD